MFSNIRTNYSGHEAAYQLRKARGDAGWGSPDCIAEEIAGFDALLREEYVPKRGRFLEVGCGAGEIALWFGEQGFEVYGVDLAPTAIAWAREKTAASNIPAVFQVGDVLNLQDFADDFFDFVLDGHCFHCIIPAVQPGETRTDRERFLSSVWRVLKPGGYFRVNTMCGDPPDALKPRFDVNTRCMLREGPMGPFAERYHGMPQDILNEIRSAGFVIRRWHVAAAEHSDESDDLLVDAIKP